MKKTALEIQISLARERLADVQGQLNALADLLVAMEKQAGTEPHECIEFEDDACVHPVRETKTP